MTIAVDLGRKATKQTNQNLFDSLITILLLKGVGDIAIAFVCISGFCLLCYLLNNWKDYPTKFVEQLVYATAKFQYPMIWDVGQKCPSVCPFACNTIALQTVCLFVLLLYVPSQQLWSWRDGQFT